MNAQILSLIRWCGLLLCLSGLFSSGLSPGAVAATVSAAPRVLPDGRFPEDRRRNPLKDLDGYFPFTPAASVEAWNQRAEQVRRQILVATGLWPMPTRTPLNAVVHGRVEREDYTVEKVYFESVPGFFVTGSLYRPKSGSGRRAAVLCPHGHWADGRFHDAGREAVRKEIVQGAERFEEGGRSPLQARCVQLARMGGVVFHYDMIGYADSAQISQALAHGFAKQRPEMNTAENWGLFSPPAEAHLQSVMGLQTWNSIRALDFLLTLPDVDPERIGVTGASGGGTQTFILCAIDSRPAVAFPAVMVSTAMQGGCTCENCCGLRVDTGNVEFAALFAPKPLGLTAADDWTREMPSKGYPELQRHYALLGAPKNVSLVALPHFGHNYNYVSRAAMYRWFNQHLRLGQPEPVVEEDYRRLTREELSVWDAGHPRPEGGPEFERRLLRWLTEDTGRQLKAMVEVPAEFDRVVGGAVDVLVGRGLPASGTVEWTAAKTTGRGGWREILGRVRNFEQGEDLPTMLLAPEAARGDVVLWLDVRGKAGLGAVDAAGVWTPRPGVRRLLEAGVAVVGVDLFEQGEFLANGGPLDRTARVKNPREAAAYTFGYNAPVFTHRVRDVLSVLAWVRSPSAAATIGVPSVRRVDAVALDGSGPGLAVARAAAGSALDGTAIHTGGFRFGKIRDLHDVHFLPGGAKYLDLPGFLARDVPGGLWLAGEGKTPSELPEAVSAAYRRSAGRWQLASGAEAPERVAQEAVDWLLRSR